MDVVARTEYPALLARLQPSQAVQTVNERIKRITKLNNEIADWLQERRKVEEHYVASLRKLLLFRVPNQQSELGILQTPWDKLLHATDSLAASHHLLASRIEKDVEQPLRTFIGRKEMQNLMTVSANLQNIAKELDDAQEKVDKLSKKGAKANVQKVDAASSRLESATQQWESQAPFIFETLQAVDEQRVNHLRDVLTQLKTHELDQASRTQSSGEEVLNCLLEVNPSQEVQSYAQRVASGRPRLEPRTPLSRHSNQGPPASIAPSIAAHEDDLSEHSGPREGPPESRLRSRIGTILNRRRQSMHMGFSHLSPSRGHTSLPHNISSSHHSASISPKTSTPNLAGSANRLSAVIERPATGDPSLESGRGQQGSPYRGTNGIAYDTSKDPPAPRPKPSILDGTPEDIFDAPQLSGSQQSNHQRVNEPSAPTKDAEGFTIPSASNDIISQVQQEAASMQDSEPSFKLAIQEEPVPEEDPVEKQAAVSSVTSALLTGMRSQRLATNRGRREMRGTIYVPSDSSPAPFPSNHTPVPPSPSFPPMTTRATRPGGALASGSSIPATSSDSQSVRSATSLGSLALMKHPDMTRPGLNASIIEAISATFEHGEVKAVKINGEIAFSYNPAEGISYSETETIRINNMSRLEAISPNRIFIKDTPNPHEFVLDLSHLARSSAAFTYRVQAKDSGTSLAEHCPIILNPVWKPQPRKLGLLLQYKLNPASKLTKLVTLHNLVFIATYDGPRASSAQTKPAGTHVKEKRIVYWRLGDVTLPEEWDKVVCLFLGSPNGDPQPAHVEVRWEYFLPANVEIGTSISISRLSEGKRKQIPPEEDPFADDSGPLSSQLLEYAGDRVWTDISLIRKMVSGKYEGR